jgi:hypothetical protein
MARMATPPPTPRDVIPRYVFEDETDLVTGEANINRKILPTPFYSGLTKGICTICRKTKDCGMLCPDCRRNIITKHGRVIKTLMEMMNTFPTALSCTECYTKIFIEDAVFEEEYSDIRKLDVKECEECAREYEEFEKGRPRDEPRAVTAQAFMGKPLTAKELKGPWCARCTIPGNGPYHITGFGAITKLDTTNYAGLMASLPVQLHTCSKCGAERPPHLLYYADQFDIMCGRCSLNLGIDDLDNLWIIIPK